MNVESCARGRIEASTDSAVNIKQLAAHLELSQTTVSRCDE